MWLLILEAFMAMMVLVFIVWWTMFSGKKQDPGQTGEAVKPPKAPEKR